MRFRIVKKYKISDLYNISSGLSKSRKDFGFGDPFVSFKDVFYNYFLPRNLDNLANTNEKEKEKCSIKKGDILLTRTSETQNELGMSCVALKDYENATFNGFTKRLRLKDEVEEEIDPFYIGYYMRSNLMRSQINSISIMTTRASLNNSMINNLEIEIPTILEQARIGKTLRCLDEKIEINNKINKNLESMAQEIFKHWFVDFEFPDEKGNPYKSSGGVMVESEMGLIPEGWETGRLDDVADFQNGYAFKSKELIDEGREDCFHVFKMGHIKKGGGLNKEGTKSYIPKNECDELSKYVLKKGDLLMCMTDMKSNVALLGHTALMDEDDKYIVNQRVGLIRARNKEKMNFPYLFILTNSNDFIEDLRSRANSGVQVNLSTKEIKESLIVIPNKYILGKFNKITEGLFEQYFNLGKENSILTNLRNTLLPKLMSGELRVPLDNGEPQGQVGVEPQVSQSHRDRSNVSKQLIIKTKQKENESYG